MTRVRTFTAQAGAEVFRFVTSCTLGMIGGALCGAGLSLFFLGNDRAYQPLEGFSSPVVYCILLGAFFGAIIGAILTILSYPLIRKVGAPKLLWPAVGRTLVGALLGYLCPPLIIPLAVLGFFFALSCATEQGKRQRE